MVKSSVESVEAGEKLLKVNIKNKKGEIEVHEAEIVLSAVGISPNVENIGLEELNIEMEKGRVKVDEYYRTNVEGVYAIGDIVHGPALAHVASAEAICCVEHIAGVHTETIDYTNIPGCTYTTPEVASVGLNEAKAREAGYELKIGKFPFTASGKASAAGANDGFIKLIFNAADNTLLGAHMVGDRDDCRNGTCTQNESYRPRHHQNGTPAPDHERSRDGSCLCRLRRGNSPLNN